MNLKNRRIILATATAGSVFANQAKGDPVSAWSKPKWGFVDNVSLKEISPKAKAPTQTLSIEFQRESLHKSLVFDQPTDKVSFRPWDRIEERKVVQARDVRPEVITSSVRKIESAPISVPTEAFVKFAAIEAIRDGIVNSLEKKVSALSQQSVAPIEVSAATSSAQEIISGSESPDAYISRYARNPAALTEKLNEVNSSFLETASAAVEVIKDAAASVTQVPASNAASTNSAATVPAPVVVTAADVETSPLSDSLKLRLDGIAQSKPDPAVVANASMMDTKKVDSRPLSSDTEIHSEGALTLSKAFIPKADMRVAKLVIIDEESMTAGEKLGIENASIHWIGTESGLVTKSQKGGALNAPYSSTGSMRFVVKAPGYLPAIGYVSQGLVSQVLLYKESRLGPVVKSLNVVPDSSRVMVFGKVLDFKGQPVPNVVLDASTSKPFKVFYSLGGMGLFHPRATATGPTGDFFVSGINTGIQYFMPTVALNAENNFSESVNSGQLVEWPAHIINLSGVGPVATITIQQAEQRIVKTQIVDAFTLERPSGVGIQLTVGGQRGVHIPDQQGDLEIPEMYRRSSPDLVEVRAQGYLKTWITGSAEKGSFPENVAIFTQLQVDTLLAESLSDIQLTKGVVFGNLRPEIFKAPVEIRVFDSFGKKAVDAKVLYFDDKNLARGSMTETDRVVQNFAVTNLNPGEWQVIAIDPLSRRAVGAQIVRVENDTISQLQF